MDPRHHMYGPKRDEMTQGCKYKQDRDYKGWASFELGVYCSEHRNLILHVMESTAQNGRYRVTWPCYG